MPRLRLASLLSTARHRPFGTGRARAWVALVASVVGAGSLLAGCDTSPPGLVGPEGPAETAPPTVDWVGRWRGAATGTVRGDAVDAAPVTLEIRFDQPTSPRCAGCVTATLGELFRAMHLYPQTSISADWIYADGSLEHRLQVQKFSTGATPGSSLIGTLTIRDVGPTPDPSVEVTLDLVLERGN